MAEEEEELQNMNSKLIMEPNKVVGEKKKKGSSGGSIESLGFDVLSMIFVSLDHLDLARCSSVCISWYNCINTSILLKEKYCKQRNDSHDFSNGSSSLEASLKTCFMELAMEQHRVSLQNGPVDIYQWNAHSARVDQCRMKMGLILTGVGDKVVRIWSLESYKCLEEYYIPDMSPLADFDFDESKIVGLLKTRICIWRRHGERSLFPSRVDKVTSGLCMRMSNLLTKLHKWIRTPLRRCKYPKSFLDASYIDPEAVVGCGDGTARVFDMYSKKCSQIIRMHGGPVTCLALTDDQLIISGSSAGSITMADRSSDQRVASLKSADSTGIRTLCFNPSSSLVFAGSTAGYAHCWDIRTMQPLWEKKVCTNVIYSMQHMRNETSSLAVGGIDGVLRILNQNTGKLVSSYVIGEATTGAASSTNRCSVVHERKARKLSKDDCLDSIPKYTRPPITCLAVGMKKIVTAHNSKVVRVWEFNR